MAELPIMPLATDAYLADTTHLTTIEHGAYLLLIITMWRAGGRLPADPRKLAKFARLSPAQFDRIWPSLEVFFFVDGDQIGQGKCDDFLEAVRQKSRKASDSARAKWRKTKHEAHANASPEQCERYAIQDPRSKEREAKASPKKVGRRLPDDWFLSREQGEWAVSIGLSVDRVRLEAEKFRDHWHAASTPNARKLDWPAAWRNWCRKAIDNLPKHSPKRTDADDRFAHLMDFAQRRDERRAAEQRVANGENPDPSPTFLGSFDEPSRGNHVDGGLAGRAGRPASDGDREGGSGFDPIPFPAPANAWRG